MTHIPLTKREDEVYTFILAYLEDNNDHAPSYQAIANHFGFTKAMATNHCKSLEEKGWMKFGVVEPAFRTVKVIPNRK